MTSTDTTNEGEWADPAGGTPVVCIDVRQADGSPDFSPEQTLPLNPGPIRTALTSVPFARGASAFVARSPFTAGALPSFAGRLQVEFVVVQVASLDGAEYLAMAAYAVPDLASTTPHSRFFVADYAEDTRIGTDLTVSTTTEGDGLGGTVDVMTINTTAGGVFIVQTNIFLIYTPG
jgi:hypothetical protein